ncbi:MAG TPA: hypothetical protein VFJ87_00265 [Rhodanobacteraceae bacterium]|nr:hypothetical protein [Rhodanobacteraceae bacterium]
MRHPLHPRSRSFRAVLGMALLAWTMLASGALAGPLHKVDATGMTAVVQAAQPAAVHCDAMTTTHRSHTSHPVPMHPAGNGHGCCHNGVCHCASSCSGIAGVPAMFMTWQPVHDRAPALPHAEPVRVHTAPPLRPPIA